MINLESKLKNCVLIQVVYVTMKGWKQSIAGVRKFKDLPVEAQAYIQLIEEHLDVPGKHCISRSCNFLLGLRTGLKLISLCSCFSEMDWCG